ncbi:Galactose oxidase [Paramyrothecium foliicola]|nr:Galactose oxidase [Paramyrothecium foliicola]
MARYLSPLSLVLLGLLLFCEVVYSQQAYPWAVVIPRTGWTASADSSQPGFEPSKAIDNNASTFWHSTNGATPASLPHQITVDMKQRYVVTGISYQPRSDASQSGIIIRHTLSISDDGQSWRTAAEGYYLADNTIKYVFFTASTARYIRLSALSEIGGNQWSSAAEIHVYTPVPAVAAADFVPVPPSQGRWGPTIQLPIVPAAASITTDNVVVLWSADRIDNFPGGTGKTWTSTYNPATGAISSFQVTNIRHDMFCPGTSIDEQGRVIVTGGNDESKTSVYSPATGAWTSLALMARPRGYQSSVTLGDGRIFAIGGSWSGEVGNKHGEIYDIAANTWTRLDGCSVTRIQTNDPGGPYKSDNHAWLFAWKKNLVFNAGPSTRMTWFNVSGQGSWKEGGNRGTDTDSMSGIAAMYDAEKGLILTAGGSIHYAGQASTKNVHIIELGAENTPATVTKVADMAYARTYHNSVILPNGKVVVIGGQTFARNFKDSDTVLPVELFDPATNTWSFVAPISVPRNYHSIALLLPDARVISSGGGLCGRCRENHPDAQIWTPPYLLKADGSAAVRPTIVSVSAATARRGATITITTNVAATFSLIRYASTTHTVNTDQRRIALKATASGLTYTVVLPGDSGVLVPGPWMLFALNADGVPSVAKTLRVIL